MKINKNIFKILINKLNIKSLTAGDDFKFGNNQSGTVNDWSTDKE